MNATRKVENTCTCVAVVRVSNIVAIALLATDTAVGVEFVVVFAISYIRMRSWANNKNKSQDWQ